MTDKAPDAPVVPVTPDVTPAPADTPQTPSVPDFVKDPDAAYAEIKRLREENADKRTKLNAIEAQQKADADAKLVADGKLKELLDAKTAELETTQKQFKKNAVDNALRLEATRAGVADPNDALALVNMTGVAVSEDGTVSGATEAIAALVAAKPYLKAPAAPAAAPALAPTNPGSPTPLTLKALAAMTQEQIAAMNPDDLAAAMRNKG